MELFYRKYGEGTPVIIVHGLYGSSDNWVTIGREIASEHEVFIIDQRNHGKSPHSSEHNYMLMKNDLLEFMDKMKIEKAHLIGHSMGGKTIMFFAADYPDRVSSLVVVDISPRSYKSLGEPSSQTVDHLNIITALMNINLKGVTSRKELDDQLKETIHSKRIRQFLLKNAEREDQENFRWQINLPALRDSMPAILDGMDVEPYLNGNGITGFPALFIRGEKSHYINEQDYPLIKTIFPTADIVSIPKAGHWVHAEQQDLFLKNVGYFLRD